MKSLEQVNQNTKNKEVIIDNLNEVPKMKQTFFRFSPVRYQKKEFNFNSEHK